MSGVTQVEIKESASNPQRAPQAAKHPLKLF